MGADGEEELEEQLVGGRALGVPDPPVLAADLAELARPVGHERRSAGVLEERIDRPLRPVVAPAQLERIASQSSLSRDVYEVVCKSLS